MKDNVSVGVGGNSKNQSCELCVSAHHCQRSLQQATHFSEEEAEIPRWNQTDS